jgi:phosphoribosylformimino-5-aminoimidazole carboxamide ribotide isomerase
MVIIPVIDISQGQVVHARQGQRDSYKPVQSQLYSGSDPVNIVRAFHAFGIIYIADLDSIAGTGDNNRYIEDILESFKYIELWIDTGKLNQNEIINNNANRLIPVIGSEYNVSPQLLSGLIKNNSKTILSLDFMDRNLLGDSDLLKHSSTWPENIIIMNLTRVGSQLGPDTQLIKYIQELAGSRNIYTAGGTRNINDLMLLESINIKGVLLATALHERIITSKEIKSFCK